jgi:hypothetical protein
MEKHGVAIACLVCMLPGCSSQYVNRASVDSTASRTFSVQQVKVRGSLADQDAADRRVLEDGLNEVLNFCLPRLSGYEKKSADQAELAFWLSMSGLLAGAVAVPALTAAAAQANAAWIAGLSGWAGATNFASQVLRSSGLSGSAIAETRNTIIRNLKEQIAVASDGSKTFEERRNALMKARAECVVYEISVPTVPDQKPN